MRTAICFGLLMAALGCSGRTPANSLLTLPATDDAKLQATRAMVAWIVEGTRIAGFHEDYPDAQIMAAEKRFFVACDFLPQDAVISADPRVRRIAEADFERQFNRYGFASADYLIIKLSDESQDHWTFSVHNLFGSLGAHGFELIFRRTAAGLRATGQLLWVS